MSSVALGCLLEKLTSTDKDHRYMATSDLARELQSDECILDDFESKRVVAAVLKQVNDRSGDISGLANTCLGALVGKVESKYVQEMFMALLEQMKTGQDAMKRDVAYLGLKSLIQNLGVAGSDGKEGSAVNVNNNGAREGRFQSQGNVVDKRAVADVVAEFLGPWLIECVQSDNEEIASNGYDLLLMFLTQHGPLFPSLTLMAEICAKECEDPRPGIRKKAMQCLGKMSASLPIADFHAICKRLIGKIGTYSGRNSLTVSEMQQAQSLVMSLSFVGRGAGFRMGEHVPEAIAACLCLVDSGMKDEEVQGVELIEACLGMLELCMLRCPHNASARRAEINDKAILCLRYDPNYAMDSDMDDGDGSQSGDGESDDDYSDDGFSDDDDCSWRVRRAACKVLSAEIEMYCGTNNVRHVYDGCQKAIVKQAIGEREETVRQEVFNVYLDLIAAVHGSNDEGARNQLDEDMEHVALRFVKMIKKQSAKIKVCIFKVLTKMIAASPGCILFWSIIPRLATDMVAGLKDDSSSALQLQILQMLEVGFGPRRSAPDVVFANEIIGVMEVVFECTHKKYFALAAASLRVCQNVVYLIRPQVEKDMVADLSCLVLPLFVTATDVLSSSDKPQEVKNAAISCTGHALSQMGDLLEDTQVESLAKDFAAMPSNSKRAKRQGSNETSTGHMPRLKDVVTLLIERLGNETTRLAALVALKRLVESPLQLEINAALGDATSFIKSYLKKLDRQVRITSVETLSAIVTCRAGQLDQAEVDSIIGEVSGLLSDEDLGVSNAVIALLGDVVVSSPGSTQSLLDKVLDNIHRLLSSSTLQASSLDKLIKFLEQAIAHAPDQKGTTKDLIDFGLSCSTKRSSTATAKCVASLAARSDESYQIVNEALVTLGRRQNVQEKNFLLYCIRELAANQLSLSNDDQLRDAVAACMNGESIGEAAAAALGGLASGGNASHLDYIIDTLSEAKEKKLYYPMFRALDEGLRIMVQAKQSSMDDADRHLRVTNIIDILFKMNRDVNDEVKVIIAECYGFAAIICPDTVLPTFKTQLESDDAASKNMALLALKNCIVDSDQDIDEALASIWLPMAMEKLADRDVSVRRSATLLLSLAVHSKFSLVRNILGDCLPPLLEQTKPDESLVRTIDLGPFKHKIDDGLEQRKSAFDCLGILLDKCWDCVPNNAIIVESIVAGAADEYEVKLKCHDLLVAVSHKDPSPLLAFLDHLVTPFTKTLSKRVKADGVRQEIDRNEDMLRSCLRAVDALSRIDGSDNVASFKTFVGAVGLDAFLGPRLRAIQKERNV